MNAGTLEISLQANVARLARDMDQAKASVGNAMAYIERAADLATKALGLLGVGVGVAGLMTFVKRAIDAADALDDLAQSTGVATERLSQLQYAARVGGGSVEGLTGIMQKLNRSIADGRAGDKEKLFIFKQLGVTMDDLKSKKTDEVMLKVADGFSKARDGAGKVAVAQELMGKTADGMIPFLNNGAEAIRNMMRDADKLGLTIGGDFAQQAGEFNDNLEKMRASSEKLSILLAGDLITSLGKAAKAFADATIEGGKFKGLIAGVQTFLTGDDQHKNNVKFVELTEKLFIEENKLLKLRSQKAPAFHIAMQEEAVRRTKEELALTQNYRKALTEVAEAEKAAGDAAKAARETGPELQTTPKAVTQQTSAYEGLVKSLSEKVAAEREELKVGRELNEYEKLRLKVLTDIGASKKKLTGDELAHVSSLLEEARVLMDSNELRERRLKQLQAEAAYLAEVDEEMAAAEAAESKAREQFAQSIDQQTAALRDSGEALKLEATLLGATDRERSVVIEHLRIEQQLRRELDALSRNLNFNEAQRDIERERLRNNAKLAMEQAEQRGAIEEQLDVWRSIDQTAHDVFVNIFEDGAGTFKRLGQTLKAAVLDLLYQMTVKRWIISIGASMGGIGTAAAGQAAGGAASSFLGSIGSSLFGGTGGIATGAGISGALFGTGGGASALATSAGALEAGALVSGVGGTAGIMGGLTTALAAVPVWGWIAAGIATLVAIAKKGETRQGVDTQFFHGVGARNAFEQSGGNPLGGTSATMLAGAALAINTMLAGAGIAGTVAEAHGGFASSDKGRGGIFSGGNISLGGRLIPFGEPGGRGVDSYEANSNRSPSLEEAAQAYGLDLLQMQIQALKAVAPELPKTLQEMVNGIADAEKLTEQEATQFLAEVARVTDGVKSFRAAAELMPFENLRGLSFDAAAGLIELAGGLDTLLQRQESYYQNFFKEEERRAQTFANVSKALADVGLAMPTAEKAEEARAAFRALVEAQELTTEEGRKTWNVLMQVQGAFADLHPIIEEVAEATDDLADKHRDFLGKMDRYHELYFSQTELRMKTALQIQQRLAQAGNILDIGYILNADRGDFRDVFEAEFAAGNQVMVEALLDVADLFAQMTPEIESFAEAVDDTADVVESAVSGIARIVSSLRDQIGELKGSIGTNRGFLDDLLAVKRELTAGSLSGLTGEGLYHATRNEFMRLSSLAANDVERLKGLPEAVRAFMAASQQHQGGSSMRFLADRNLAMGALGASEGSVRSAIEVAEIQLDVMERQLAALEALKDLQAAGNAGERQAAAEQVQATGAAAGWSASTISTAITGNTVESIRAGLVAAEANRQALLALQSLTTAATEAERSAAAAQLQQTAAAANWSATQISGAVQAGSTASVVAVTGSAERQMAVMNAANALLSAQTQTEMQLAAQQFAHAASLAGWEAGVITGTLWATAQAIQGTQWGTAQALNGTESWSGHHVANTVSASASTITVGVGAAVASIGQSISAALQAMQPSSPATPAANAHGFQIGPYAAGSTIAATSVPAGWIIDPHFGMVNAKQILEGFHQANDSIGAYKWLANRNLTQGDAAHLLGIDVGYVRNWFAAQGIGYFDVGTDYVPRDMLAVVHEGERITPKRYNPAAGDSLEERLDRLCAKTEENGNRLDRLTGAFVDYAQKDLNNSDRIAQEMGGAAKAAQLVSGNRARDLST